MDLIASWPEIRKHFNESFKTNFHVSVASVDKDNNPTVTPIGSLFLNRDQTGFYFEKFPSKLPANFQINRQVCVLAVNSNTWFWLKSLFMGRFEKYAAIRLYGQLGEKRMATEIEIKRLNARMRITKPLKGNKYLWGDMKMVRDISFTSVEKINLGRMTQ